MSLLIIFIISCILTYIIITLYYFISYKMQSENFKNATYIYLSKKLNCLSEFIMVLRPYEYEFKDFSELTKIRNSYDDSLKLSQNINILKDCNQYINQFFIDFPDAANNPEIINAKEKWYDANADLRTNYDLYVTASENYNKMFNNFICKIVVNLLKYQQEEI